MSEAAVNCRGVRVGRVGGVVCARGGDGRRSRARVVWITSPSAGAERSSRQLGATAKIFHRKTSDPKAASKDAREARLAQAAKDGSRSLLER